MGRIFQEQLGCSSIIPTKIYVCKECLCPLTTKINLVSKDFRSKSGPAYLFNHYWNMHTGIPDDRELLSGLHTVADLYCNICGQNIGWKYVSIINTRNGERNRSLVR